MKLSAFVDHLPFAYDLIAELGPRRFVELGSHNGVSFFTFCQSVQENRLDTMCYAVDSWEGDEHTGAYSQEVFEAVQTHARTHYRENTYLLKMWFHEALEQFSNDSVGLLHIDGLHTYAAVKEDFERWYPRVEPGGIVLFHDVEARLKGYGVWKFWEALSTQFDSFTFRHGFGLGVLRKPGGQRSPGPLERLLFEGSDEERRQLRSLYSHASHFMQARRLSDRVRLQRKEKQRAEAADDLNRPAPNSS
ncbi:MAG: class I SAM-dependent methyltransferase [Pseudomonadota bacterium]